MSLPPDKFNEVEQAITMLLKALGCDLADDHFRDTPRRVARLYSTILDGNYCEVGDITSFKTYTGEGYVTVRHVPFYAFCAHHLLPFFGYFDVAYIPWRTSASKVLGLSKLIRLVRHACKIPTTQEALTARGVSAVTASITNRGVIVRMVAEHMCMTLRGAKSPGCATITMSHSGLFQSDALLRAEFLTQCVHGA